MEIVTERLRLREVEPADVEVIHTYRLDPQYLEHYPQPGENRAETQAFIDRCIAWAQERPRSKFQLAITALESGELMGNCGIRRALPNAQCADLGYELAPKYWGRGFASEAAGAMLRLAFEDLELERVEAICVVANERSFRLLRRLGFREMRRIPAGTVSRGYAWPERCLFALKRSEWLNAISCVTM